MAPEINVQKMEDVGRQIGAAAQLLSLRPALEGDRLTTQVRLYHESPGEETMAISCNSSRMLKTKEQSFHRKITVTEQPQGIDLGWFQSKPEDIGVITIENRVGANKMVVSSEEEAAEEAKQIIAISLRGDSTADLLVSPGDCQILNLAKTPNVWIWSLAGSIKVILTIIGK